MHLIVDRRDRSYAQEENERDVPVWVGRIRRFPVLLLVAEPRLSGAPVR